MVHMIKYFKKQHTEKGAALMVFIIFFMFIGIAVSFAVSRSVFGAAAEYSLLERSKQANYSAEALAEDIGYRNIDPDRVVNTTENNTFFNVAVSATTTDDTVNGLLLIAAEGIYNNVYRGTELVLVEGSGASFNFGVQTGNGGILMENGSSVLGNVFSNGSVVGNKAGAGAKVYGDVISAGPYGWVEEIHATGTIRSNTIHDVWAEGDAYYVTEDAASVVDGTRYFPAADQATATMPIPDSVIESWENNLTASGTIITSTSTECTAGPTPGSYTISSDDTIGDLKIECNLIISGSGTDIVLTGPVWVLGNVTINQIGTISAHADLGAKSVQIIADNPANRSTSSKFIVAKADFQGSGNPLSNVTLFSQNTDAEDGGSEIAIKLTNTITGELSLYSAHGAIELANQQTFEAITAYQVYLKTGADVVYDTGLKNELFSSGPGGGYTVTDWYEI